MRNHSYPVLYSFRRCPYAMRARLALVYAGIKVELREVQLANKPPALLDASAKATVPVLVVDDDSIIDESLDIMRWALSQHDPDHWLTESLDQQTLTETLIQHNDVEFKTHLDHYKYSDRFPQHSPEEYRNQGEVFLATLERQLNQQQYLIRDRATLADYAIFPFIRQFAHVDNHWFNQAAYPRLQKWLSHLLESPLFVTSMSKYAVWHTNDTVKWFPK